jgi:hypothetical protein
MARARRDPTYNRHTREGGYPVITAVTEMHRSGILDHPLSRTMTTVDVDAPLAK